MKQRIRLLILPLLLAGLLAIAGGVRADTVHVVEPGDTLFTISLLYGVSMETIAQANGIENIRLISIGQELIIPGVDGPVGSTPAPTPPPPPPPAGPPVARAVEGGVLHTVGPRDTLFTIAMLYNVSMADIQAANNMGQSRVVRLGRELLIPGATLPDDAAPPATGETTAAAPAAPVASANLFRNGSFEEDWYFYLFNELQIPVGWQFAYDENPNTLQPGSGGNFNRPEVRVVGRDQLSEDEWGWFLFDGDKTLKAFKGDAPTTFSLFQDVYLQPGRYRMTLNFFPDIVARYYPGGARDFHTDPLSGEVRVIHNNGGTGWTTVTAGQPNNRVYEFTVSQPGAVRLGASFRNRFETANNGWFLDNWKLERIQ